MISKIKDYDILDLTKIILALMVVAIHTKLFPLFLYPWLRLAVPMFFIISAFLLYSKINNSPIEKKHIIIRSYILRLLKLYLFWFIILLPITIYVRISWFDDGIIIGIMNLIFKPFLGSTFVASWYLSATIIGTLIVDKLSSKLSYKLLIPIFIIINLLCCLLSSYSFLFTNLRFLNLDNVFLNIFEPYCSFPVSLIYILLGKIISEKKFILLNKYLNFMLILISLILLYIEWFLIYKLSGIYNNDCYIFLIPASLLITSYLLRIKVKIKFSKILRQLSNFLYPLHGSIAIIVNKIFIRIIGGTTILGFLSFVTTLIICLFAFFIVKKIELKIKILKYAY